MRAPSFFNTSYIPLLYNIYSLMDVRLDDEVLLKHLGGLYEYY